MVKYFQTQMYVWCERCNDYHAWVLTTTEHVKEDDYGTIEKPQRRSNSRKRVSRSTQGHSEGSSLGRSSKRHTEEFDA